VFYNDEPIVETAMFYQRPLASAYPSILMAPPSRPYGASVPLWDIENRYFLLHNGFVQI